jgi:hypothetical protein
MAEGFLKTNFTLAEILVIHQRAKEFLFEGKTLMSWNEAGSSASKQFTLPVDVVLKECEFALQRMDPATYGRPRNVAASHVSGYLPK